CELQQDLIALSAKYGFESLAGEASHCNFGPHTRHAVVTYQERNKDRLLAMRDASPESWRDSLGIVDTATAQALTDDVALQPRGPRVTGIIRTTDGRPVPGVEGRAYDQDLRQSELLGKPAKTGADGRFEIPYSSKDYAAGEAGTADV